MTEEEMAVLREAWEKFCALSVVHDSDRHEFMHAIHVAQNIVLARLVERGMVR